VSVAAPIVADRRRTVFERPEATWPVPGLEPRPAEAAELELPRRFRGTTLLMLLVCGQAVWFVILGYLLVRLGT
jgi:hypothetical protein